MPDSASAPLSLKTGLPLLRLPSYWSPDQASSAIHVSSDLLQTGRLGQGLWTGHIHQLFQIQPGACDPLPGCPRPPVYLCPLYAPPSMARWRTTHPGFREGRVALTLGSCLSVSCPACHSLSIEGLSCQLGVGPKTQLLPPPASNSRPKHQDKLSRL